MYLKDNIMYKYQFLYSSDYLVPSFESLSKVCINLLPYMGLYDIFSLYFYITTLLINEDNPFFGGYRERQ